MTKFYTFWVRVWVNFWYKNGITRVGSFSYTVILSFIPFTISVGSIINFLPISHLLINKMEKFIFRHFLPTTGDFVYHQFQRSFHHIKSISWLGLISLFITTYLMFRSLEKHINEMWHVKIHRKHKRLFLIYLTFMLIGPVFVVSLLLLAKGLNKIWLYPLSTLLSILCFTAIYKVLSIKKVHVLHALFAGMIAGILFEIAKIVFIFYARHFPLYDLLYGSLAVLPLFLIWIYISSFILLFCAQIVHILEVRSQNKVKFINYYEEN